MQRFFRKVERKLSSENVTVERQQSKLFLEGVQLTFLGLSIYELKQGNWGTALAAFSFALFFERLAGKIYSEVLRDKKQAEYIADHYSAFTRLPEMLQPTAEESLRLATRTFGRN